MKKSFRLLQYLALSALIVSGSIASTKSATGSDQGTEPKPAGPVVSIKAVQPIAEETSNPLKRIALAGEFAVSRTGATDEPLLVFVAFSGTATPGDDYDSPPFSVTIPKGADSVSIQISPKNDQTIEGIETVVARISNCPPDTRPPLGIRCSEFEIDPAHESATVFIRDDGVTVASLNITKPAEEARFRAGETIDIEAIAIDLEGYISRVEFWDGEKQIGVSELFFFRAPDPGTPIQHNFEWNGADSGEHTLTARTKRADGSILESLPVHITVGPTEGVPPRITITQPTTDTKISGDSPLEITAEGTDPDGYIHRAEFFVDGKKVGESSIEFFREPDPGQKQMFSFVWRQPTPGAHILTAAAIDNAGLTGWSDPVKIQVGTSELPFISVTATANFVIEPETNAEPKVASFEISRFGSTNGDLRVEYNLLGSAANGVDYEKIPTAAVIPAGEKAVTVTVKPLHDGLTEGIETVILSLRAPLEDIAAQYQIGRPSQATILISDRPMIRPSGAAQFLSLPDGSLSVSFSADVVSSFRVEASTDLRNWETVCEALPVDQVLHFIDDQAAKFPSRFYRLVSEPASTSSN